MKSAIYAVIIIVMIGSCLVAITANNNALEVQQKLDQERYTRMLAEENLQGTASQIKNLENQLKEANKKLELAQSKLENIQTIVSEKENLESQLNHVTSIKNSLEKKVQQLEIQPQPATAQNIKMQQ